MARTGIDDPWRPDDDPEPEPLTRWVDAGIPREEAKIWRQWRYRISEARAWRRAGVSEGLLAAQWSTAGVTATTVEAWRMAGFDATEAVTWREFGFELDEATQYKGGRLTPGEAWDHKERSSGSDLFSFFSTGHVPMSSGTRMPRRAHFIQRFADCGASPEVAESYIRKQWLDDTALSWAKAGVDAYEVHLWQELGLRPAEAGRLTRQGGTVSQTVRDWWSAGIPFDEVAVWIGAGLNPEEAVAQRARGITAEQAATLRALRDDPD